MTKKIPELRFAGFSGEWEERKLGEIGDNIGGGTPSTKVEKYWSGDIPWYQSSDFIEGNLFNNTANKFINEESIKKSAAKKVENIPAIAIVTRVGVGKVSLMNEVYSTSQDFLNFHNLKWEPNFSAICIYKLMQKQKHMLQGTSIKGITKSELLNIKTIIPTYTEQEKIGELFETLDACLEDQGAYVEDLKKSKKAFLQKLFPKKDAKVPELRFPGFEGDWEEKNLGDIGSIYSGLSGKTKEDFGKGNAKFIEFSNVLANAVANEDMLGQIDIDEKQNTVKSGDILFNSSSETPEEVGMSSVWTRNIDNLYLNSFCIGFRPNIKLDNYFIAYLLRNGESRKQIILLAQGISRYNISRIGLTKIKILLPSLPEQEKIGTFFKELDYKIEKEEDKLSSLERLKTALLQKVFV